ncbi:YcbK family protein [Lentilitoribacter sp. EG35]|uniref:YcbK family protein n=1 Tax=Lentilitoribacter sp. EG35 TaxID=3234192 RepID=UPI0034607FD7
MRIKKHTTRQTLSFMTKLAVPVAVGLFVSGCVSTETSFLPTDADLQLAQQSSSDSIDDQTGSELASSDIQEGGVPVPYDRNENIVAAYSGPAANGNPATSQDQTNTPAQILAGGIVGSASGSRTSLIQQTSTASNNVTAGAKPAGSQTSVVASNKNIQKQSSFFSRLFKTKEPNKAVPVDNAQIQPAQGQEVASLTPEEPAKKQITEAKEVASAAATPLPTKTKTKKKSNVFASLFGLKSGTDEDGVPEKTVKLASAAIGGLARLSPLALQRQTERVDVACLKPELVRLLKKVERYYKRPVVVTSGYRSPKSNKRIGGASGSKHTTCEAADVQVKGVSKWDLAKYVRALPERGGVGTYCHTQSVHIDIGSARDWNWRCRKRRK